MLYNWFSISLNLLSLNLMHLKFNFKLNTKELFKRTIEKYDQSQRLFYTMGIIHICQIDFVGHEK